MNLPTAIVLLVVLGMVVVAIHFLRMRKGKCSCGENKKVAVRAAQWIARLGGNHSSTKW